MPATCCVVTNCLVGWAASNTSRGITEEQVKRDVLLAAQPTKQFVTTQQVAGTAVFLCSDSAASITGTNMMVEGGWTAH